MQNPVVCPPILQPHLRHFSQSSLIVMPTPEQRLTLVAGACLGTVYSSGILPSVGTASFAEQIGQ